jgi:hypothetical protein
MLFTECNALKSAIPSTLSTTASPPGSRSFDTGLGILCVKARRCWWNKRTSGDRVEHDAIDPKRQQFCDDPVVAF